MLWQNRFNYYTFPLKIDIITNITNLITLSERKVWFKSLKHVVKDTANIINFYLMRISMLAGGSTPMDHELSANLVSIIAIGTFIEASFDCYLFYFKMKLHVTMEKVLRTNIGNFISVFWWVTFIKKKLIPSIYEYKSTIFNELSCKCSSIYISIIILRHFLY